MGQIIGKTGVVEMGVGEMGVIHPRMHFIYLEKWTRIFVSQSFYR